MPDGRQVAFLFDEAADSGLGPEKIGNKARSLVAMTQWGMPVPPGFVIVTGVCRAYLEHGALPVRLAWQAERCIKALEARTGKQFGGGENPLLVSVRSGAPVSMPGMMDTILNLGLSPQCLPALRQKFGDRFADDIWNRFQTGFSKVVGATPPVEQRQQLRLAIEAVCRSWQNPRAQEYRCANGIPEGMGTAVTVQVMVFGNLDQHSGTGVAFSRNVATGDKEFFGEFLPCAQGEDVVGGGVTPLPIAVLAEINPQAFRELGAYVRELEIRHGDVVDVEFTLEAGRLWILQSRRAKRTPVAAVRFAVQAVWEKRLDKAGALGSITEQELATVQRPAFSGKALAEAADNGQFFAKGLAVSPGAAVGKVVFSSERAREAAGRGEKVILFRPDTNPDDLPGMMASVALVTATGGATSHAAVVARGLGIPAVVGIAGLSTNGRAEFEGCAVNEGDVVSVDGAAGLVLLGALPLSAGSQSKEVSIFLKWLWQTRPPRPKPAPAFGRIGEQFSANTEVNDFYLADAMASAAAGSEFELETKALRRERHQRQAKVLSAYLMLACAGELRHAWSHASGPERDELLEKLTARFALEPGTNRRGVQLAAAARLQEAKLEEQQEFLRLAVGVFVLQWSGSYGGGRWAAIAQAALDYLEGQDPMVFVDHAFDLQHNGGRLFDKHPMFSGLTNEDRLQRQLDLKKSARDIEGLFGVLSGLHNHFSQGVLELWEKGKGAVWCRA